MGILQGAIKEAFFKYFEAWQHMQYFYDGHTFQTKANVEAIANESLMFQKTPEEAEQLIKIMTNNKVGFLK